MPQGIQHSRRGIPARPRVHCEMSRLVVMRQCRQNKARQADPFRDATPDALMFGQSLADLFSTPTYDRKVIGSDQKPRVRRDASSHRSRKITAFGNSLQNLSALEGVE